MYIHTYMRSLNAFESYMGESPRKTQRLIDDKILIYAGAVIITKLRVATDMTSQYRNRKLTFV